MGSIQKFNSKWRVQIRHKGYKSISTLFSSYELAKEFHDKIEDSFAREKELLLIKNAIEKIKPD